MTVYPCPGCGQNCSDWFWNQETGRWDLGPLVIPCHCCRQKELEKEIDEGHQAD